MEDIIKVLIVEDDREDFVITQDILSQIKNKRYQVEWEQDYQKALFRIAEQDHDVYLIDYNLGANSGVELVKQCVSSGIQLPFIFLTGMDDMDTDMQAMKVGAIDYLVKDDLTPKLLERSIRYSIKQKETVVALINSNNTKDKLFSIISHDLRSPISTFMNTIELLTNNDELDEEMKADLLLELKGISKSTLNLLENLLQWSRNQIGSISIHPDNINLKSTIDKELVLFDNQLNIKSMHLVNNINGNYAAYVDEHLFKVIIRNLVSNAIKFTPELGNISFNALDKGNIIELSIADSGTGMDEQTQLDVLKPYIFKTNFGTNNERGSGLGLKLVKELVEKVGGKIWIESVLGKGSTFFFTLPKSRV